MTLTESPVRNDEDTLVRTHLPLVHYAVIDVASRVPRHVCRDDLTSAAMLGLAQAARAYDAARGVTFDRFARNRIRGALLDELRGKDWASRSVRSQSRALQAATEELTGVLGRMPTAAEVGEKAGLDAATVVRVTDDVHRATVLNYDSIFVEPAESGAFAAAEPGPTDVLLERERRAYLRDAVVALPERLRHVVVGYFFEERPMQELANELGVTESRISQMRGEALSLLGDGLRSQLDPDTLADAPETGRVAKRKCAYYAAVAAGSDFRSRLSPSPAPVTNRVKISAAV